MASTVVAGWMITEGGAYGQNHGPEMLIARRNEKALILAAAVVLKTGEKLIRAVGEEVEQEAKNGRRRKHLQVNLERFNTMASQAQEVAHAFIMTKGKCRWCATERQ